MRIGIAQLNPTVGDLEGNLSLALDAYEQLVGQGANIVVFPELFLCGYPPRDLLYKENFLKDSYSVLQQFANQTGPTPALVGFPEAAPGGNGGIFNAAAWCEDSTIKQVFCKRLLPTYDVFDESRYFESGNSSLFREYSGVKIAVTICEDIWNLAAPKYPADPLDEIAKHTPDFLINLSASPWFSGKETKRKELIQKVARKVACPVTYVNAVGGNDELIFDGTSTTVNQSGKIIAECKSFEEHICIHELTDDQVYATLDSTEMDRLQGALTLGIRDYVQKSGFSKVLIGLSGGIDSAVTAALAVEAMGADNVMGISLPSSISSEHSKDDARALAANLGIEYHTIPIESMVSAATTELSFLFEGKAIDVTEENLQARSRGLVLMAISNKFGSLLLTTGNKSELAVGYCTLYGDMCGGLAVISDVPKTQVFELARHLNKDQLRIPVNTIEKPPSAELRPDQKDSDSLPDYEILDGILKAYVEEGKSSSSIIEAGYGEEITRKVIRLVDLNEYKRNQAAPGLKTTPLAFGIGRRIPIVQKYQN
ncbi:MAG: NAD+ synthase [Opitutales bacterium]|nr:NAD+ synthase [Opitutales bacterium]